ncbi:uncharacterized protein METZ01_LOCUS408315, partial [marine metagenome]
MNQPISNSHFENLVEKIWPKLEGIKSNPLL